MASIQLARGFVCQIDDEDAPLVARYKWSVIAKKRKNGSTSAYAVASQDGRMVLMHRLIMGAQPGQCVDHADRHGLNNRRSNLRFATYSQNGANKEVPNSNGYRGVYQDIDRERGRIRWRACISVDSRTIHVGRAKTVQEAAALYDAAASRIYGEFAVLNFPQAAA
jgi:hypothetical protein